MVAGRGAQLHREQWSLIYIYEQEVSKAVIFLTPPDCCYATICGVTSRRSLARSKAEKASTSSPNTQDFVKVLNMFINSRISRHPFCFFLLTQFIGITWDGCYTLKYQSRCESNSITIWRGKAQTSGETWGPIRAADA